MTSGIIFSMLTTFNSCDCVPFKSFFIKMNAIEFFETTGIRRFVENLRIVFYAHKIAGNIC